METIINFISWVVKTFLTGLGLTILIAIMIVKSCTTAIGEQDIPTSEVQVSNIRYDVDDRDDHFEVYVRGDIKSTHLITDADATINIYDCPTTTTPVTNCNLVNDQTEGDFVDSISPGTTYTYGKNIWLYNRPAGVYVATLKFANFQG
jgi:hypothetical protein